jgi:hypothetical protein
MLNAGETLRQEQRQPQQQPPREGPPFDKVYGSSARQMHRIIDLAYKCGYCFKSHEHMAGDLGLTRRWLEHNYSILEAADLVCIDRNSGWHGVNKVHPLPRSGNTGSRRDRKAEYKTWLANAWTCSRLDLSFRIWWYLEQRSYQGEPVAVTLDKLAAALHALEQNVWTAVQKNVARGSVIKAGKQGRVIVYQVGMTTFRMEPDAAPVDHVDDEDQRLRTYLRELTNEGRRCR